MATGKKRRWGRWLLPALLIGVLGAAGSGRPRAGWYSLFQNHLLQASVKVAMGRFSREMVDPAIDDGATFSYFARPSYQLGLRGEPFATQVIDGRLWTGAAEWTLLLGPDLAPHTQRIWTLLDGYLPCIQYSVKKGEVLYSVEAFQYWNHPDSETPVNYIRVTAKNPGVAPAPAVFAGSFAYGPADHRCQRMRQVKWNPGWRYEFKHSCARRDGKTIYVFKTKPDELLARAGQPYTGPFGNSNRETPVCASVYRRTLAPGESFTADFIFPHYPENPGTDLEIVGADYDEARSELKKYWNGWLAKATRIEVPEAKVTNAVRAYLIHSLMSQNIIDDNEVEQHVNRLQYNRFWLRDSSFFVSMYEMYNLPDVGHDLARHFFGYQRPDGNMVSQAGQYDGWGQSMWAFGYHTAMAGDADFARESFPYVERAVAWLDNALKKDQYGLMPPSGVLDNEQLIGRYTGHNFWALTGLGGAITVARAAGHPDAAERWTALRAAYQERFIRIMRQVAAANGGVMPPGVDVPGGIDWGNLLPVYPGNILDPQDPLVTVTFDHYRKEHMQEGIATYGQALHHYITQRVALTELARGNEERVLSDFYGMLMHTGAAHEGFEWSIIPWASRDYCLTVAGIQSCNFPPHGWYAANMNILTRYMLVREDGDTLRLCGALSPAWTRPGDKIGVENAATLFNPVSFSFEFAETSARFKLTSADRGRPPKAIALHVPFFLQVTAASANGQEMRREGDWLYFPGRCLSGAIPCEANLEFTRLPVRPWSYETVVNEFKAEYRRRWEESKR